MKVMSASPALAYDREVEICSRRHTRENTYKEFTAGFEWLIPLLAAVAVTFSPPYNWVVYRQITG